MRTRSSSLSLALAAGLILAGGSAGYLILFDNEAPPVSRPADPAPARAAAQAAPPASAPPAAATTYAIDDPTGTVQLRRAGVWTSAKPGERIGSGDAIRTGPDGAVRLESASGDQLALRSGVALEVDSLSATVTDLRLTSGKIKAEAASGTERLRIASGGVQAIGGGGDDFTVYASPRGTVNVATETGEVEVQARNKTVTVGAGQLTQVPAGGAPADPVPIPASVFLSIAWPEPELEVARVTVRGKVAAGSIVTVNGQPASVADDGRFEALVGLREGKNPVSVVAETIDGRVARQGTEVRVDTSGPPLEADSTRLFETPKPPPKPPR